MPFEIGGEYPLQDFPQRGLDPWPIRRSFFASGRAALHAVWRRWIAEHSGARLFVPEYFCPEVVGSLLVRKIPVAFYADDPERDGPQFDRLQLSPGDMVLAVNYFGVRAGEPWTAWREANPESGLIEDHTHDPKSSWARSSRADYAFASLRKTMPVPDGAIIWSPRESRLPEAALSVPTSASPVKLAAMFYKKWYLDSGETLPGLKAAYLKLQERGEKEFSEVKSEAISRWSLDLLRRGMPTDWARRREHNVRSLLTRAPIVPGGKPLFSSWPAGHCPFNAVYIFADETAREVARKRLISAQVYTPVHWTQRHGSSASVNLSKRLLTIPLDFRCGEPEIARIASIFTDTGAVHGTDLPYVH